MLELGPRGRVLFAATYVAAQAALILTAAGRPERAFGFQMFSESSTLSVHLLREVDAMSGHGTTLVDVKDGEWRAKDAAGAPHHFAWADRVHEPGLATFDATIHASYGADAQLARLQAALDDVAAHIPDDAETRALAADVAVRRNGREAVTVHLTSAPAKPATAK